MKGCLGTARGDLLRAFLWWNLEEEAASPRRLGKNMETATLGALGRHAGTAALRANLGKSATVCNYIHTNVKIASHVFNYEFTFSSCKRLPESY